MPYDDPTDEEDWYDEDGDGSDESDETEIGHCPECAGPVYEFTNKCPACGHWITDADRRRMSTGERKPMWIKVTAVVILAILLLGLFEVSTFF